MVQGRWGGTYERDTVELPPVNSVRIEYDRTTGICNEYVENFIQKIDKHAGNL